MSFYFGIVFMLLPAVLHAQDCRAPTLDSGYFVPEQEIYLNGAQLTYSCDNGHKPAAESWWSTSTCQNGIWSPQPQCIDEKSCIPPNIPNGEYTVSQTGWYKDGNKVRIKCNKGYEHKNWDATAKCSNGTWISVPICERSADSCDAPPKIAHAVIINEEHQEIFAADTELRYECEDGFHVEETDARKSIYCLSGNWTTGPQCKIADTCYAPPKIPHAVIINPGHQEIFPAHSELKYECDNGFHVMGSNVKLFIYCLSGKWTTGPQCKPACVVNTKLHPTLTDKDQLQYLVEGSSRYFHCTHRYYFSLARCTNGYVHFSPCCHQDIIQQGRCY